MPVNNREKQITDLDGLMSYLNLIQGNSRLTHNTIHEAQEELKRLGEMISCIMDECISQRANAQKIQRIKSLLQEFFKDNASSLNMVSIFLGSVDRGHAFMEDLLLKEAKKKVRKIRRKVK